MLLDQTGKIAPAEEPWQLIRDAIVDLELQEGCIGVEIEMDNGWHTPFQSQRICQQCLAGCVISRRLGANTNSHHCPSDYTEYCSRLMALDWFRAGVIKKAYDELSLRLPPGIECRRSITPYKADPDAFKLEMLDMADDLERATAAALQTPTR